MLMEVLFSLFMSIGKHLLHISFDKPHRWTTKRPKWQRKGHHITQDTMRIIYLDEVVLMSKGFKR